MMARDGWIALPRTRGAVLLQGGISVRIRILHGDAGLRSVLLEAEEVLGQEITAEQRDFLPIGQPEAGDVAGRFVFDLPICPPTKPVLHWLEGPCYTTRPQRG